jgi:hypothetical protein
VTIPNRDLGGGFENFHVLIGAWVAKANPNFRWIFPFKPRPPKSERHGKFIKAHDAKATQLLRAAHRVPIYFAFCGCGALSGP